MTGHGKPAYEQLRGDYHCNRKGAVRGLERERHSDILEVLHE